MSTRVGRLSGARLCTAMLAGATCLASGSISTARAQDAASPTSQPAVRVGGPRRTNLFSLERLDAAVELFGEYEQRRVRVDGPGLFDSTRQTNRRLTFEEQLILDIAGDIYDPNLLSLAGTIGLGGVQERFRETYNSRTDEDSNDGFLSTYDVRADILRGKDVSGTVYGVKTRDRYSRPFLPSLHEERNDYGAAVYWADDKLPMSLTYDHRSTDRTGSRRERDDENLSEDVLRYEANWITSATHSTRFQYEYSESEERFSGSRYRFDNTRHQFRIDDELLFGSQRQHRLDTNLRWQDESGDYARDLLELGTRLSLQHSPQLTTNYQYQYSQEQVGQVEVDTHRADWQIIHQLGENLTTTANLFGLAERVDQDVNTGELGGSIDWSYTRHNRFGRFSANLSLTTEHERSDGQGNRAVVAESAAFVDPLPVQLARPDALPWTVVVWDSRRVRLYLPGLDYFVGRLRDRTILIRNPLGAIRNNGTVSVDYLYYVGRGQQRDSQLVNLNIQQEFSNGITPYYIFDFRNDDRDLPSSIFRVADYQQNRHRLGLRYRKDVLQLGAEVEVLQDEIDPYTAYRLYGSRGLWRGPQGTLDARADFSRYFFEEHERGDSMVLELALDGRRQLRRDLEAYLTSTYRYEDDGTVGRGRIHGVDVEGGFSWRLGQLTLTASVEYDLLDIVRSKEDGLTVWLRVRRDIPNALGIRR